MTEPLNPDQLRSFTPLNVLSEQQWRELRGQLGPQHLLAGQLLFRQGDHARTTYYLLSGELLLRDAEGNESQQQQALGDDEGRRLLRRRDRGQRGKLQESLHDGDEGIEVHRDGQADAVGRDPSAGELPAPACQDRHRQRHQRQYTDRVRGQDLLERKAKAGGAGQHQHQDREAGQARLQAAGGEARQQHQAGDQRDQADRDVQHGEGLQIEHGGLPDCVDAAPAEPRWTSCCALASRGGTATLAKARCRSAMP
mgnify:CR=1 FL=1